MVGAGFTFRDRERPRNLRCSICSFEISRSVISTVPYSALGGFGEQVCSLLLRASLELSGIKSLKYEPSSEPLHISAK